MLSPAEELLGGGGTLETLETYVRDHDIEEIIAEYVDGIIANNPQDKVKFWYDQLISQIGDYGELDVDEVVVDHEADFDAGSAGPHSNGSDSLRPEEKNLVSEVPGAALRQLFEATKRITKEIVPKQSIECLIQETLSLLKCDRVSVFIFDPKIDMLILSASNLPKPLRVKRGQGIAGHVFEHKEMVNIPDCYSDPRFDQSFDKVTGYVTKCMLVVPILDYEKQPVGVLQAINKLDGGVFQE